MLVLTAGLWCSIPTVAMPLESTICGDHQICSSPSIGLPTRLPLLGPFRRALSEHLLFLGLLVDLALFALCLPLGGFSISLGLGSDLLGYAHLRRLLGHLAGLDADASDGESGHFILLIACQVMPSCVHECVLSLMTSSGRLASAKSTAWLWVSPA